jgi:hypothetical protein
MKALVAQNISNIFEAGALTDHGSGYGMPKGVSPHGSRRWEADSLQAAMGDVSNYTPLDEGQIGGTAAEEEHPAFAVWACLSQIRNQSTPYLLQQRQTPLPMSLPSPNQ